MQIRIWTLARYAREWYPEFRHDGFAPERASKQQKSRNKRRNSERWGSDKVDDTAYAGEEVAGVLHTETAFNERTGEISHDGNEK